MSIDIRRTAAMRRSDTLAGYQRSVISDPTADAYRGGAGVHLDPDEKPPYRDGPSTVFVRLGSAVDYYRRYSSGGL